MTVQIGILPPAYSAARATYDAGMQTDAVPYFIPSSIIERISPRRHRQERVVDAGQYFGFFHYISPKAKDAAFIATSVYAYSAYASV